MCPVASKHGVVISQPLSMQATEIISRHQSFLSLAFWHHDSRCFSLGSCAFLRFLENAAWWHGGFLLSCADTPIRRYRGRGGYRCGADTPISGAGGILVRRRYADIRGSGDIGAAPIRRYPGLGGYRRGADTPISRAGGISVYRCIGAAQGLGDIGVSVYRCGAGAGEISAYRCGGGGCRCIGVSVRRRGLGIYVSIGVSVRRRTWRDSVVSGVSARRRSCWDIGGISMFGCGAGAGGYRCIGAGRDPHGT